MYKIYRFDLLDSIHPSPSKKNKTWIRHVWGSVMNGYVKRVSTLHSPVRFFEMAKCIVFFFFFSFHTTPIIYDNAVTCTGVQRKARRGISFLIWFLIFKWSIDEDKYFEVLFASLPPGQSISIVPISGIHGGICLGCRIPVENVLFLMPIFCYLIKIRKTSTNKKKLIITMFRMKRS